MYVCMYVCMYIYIYTHASIAIMYRHKGPPPQLAAARRAEEVLYNMI